MLERRNFRFRAWHIDSQTMYSWKKLLLENDRWHLFTALTNEAFMCNPPKYSFHAMEWTGIHDRYGTDIYEGDILKVTYQRDGKIKKEFYGVVRFGKNCCSYTSEAPQHFTMGFYIDTAMNNCGDLEPHVGLFQDHNLIDGEAFNEVIGNVFENPELLQEKNEESNEV